VFRRASELWDNPGGLGNRRQNLLHSGNVILKVYKRLMDCFVDVYGLLSAKRYHPAQLLFLKRIHAFAQSQELIEYLCDFGFASGVHHLQPNLSMNAPQGYATRMPGLEILPAGCGVINGHLNTPRSFGPARAGHPWNVTMAKTVGAIRPLAKKSSHALTISRPRCAVHPGDWHSSRCPGTATPGKSETCGDLLENQRQDWCLTVRGLDDGVPHLVQRDALLLRQGSETSVTRW
jgi:hypothetical protein